MLETLGSEAQAAMQATSRTPMSSRNKATAKSAKTTEVVIPDKLYFRIGEVAQLCGLGPFQFSRAFKHDLGTTFREFLIQRRINHALQLFGNPKASVTEVAFAAGFNDLSYFARVFRRFTFA